MPDADAGLTGPTSTGVEPRLAAVLCYVAWWVTGLVFFVLERDHKAVRFHAAQSIVLFGTLTVLILAVSAGSVAMLFVSTTAFYAARLLAQAVWIGSAALWLVLMVRTFRGETWRVPIAADFADRLLPSE